MTFIKWFVIPVHLPWQASTTAGTTWRSGQAERSERKDGPHLVALRWYSPRRITERPRFTSAGAVAEPEVELNSTEFLGFARMQSLGCARPDVPKGAQAKWRLIPVTGKTSWNHNQGLQCGSPSAGLLFVGRSIDSLAEAELLPLMENSGSLINGWDPVTCSDQDKRWRQSWLLTDQQQFGSLICIVFCFSAQAINLPSQT